MATALIKFTQDFNTDIPGRAVIGRLIDGAVIITNDNNAGVASWTISLLYAPPGSVYTPVPGTPVILAAAVSNTPVATFTPDVPGCYRVKLSVKDIMNVEDIDIRVFAIREPKHGFIIPPYQKDPEPRPTLASGEPGAKPNETNFGGSEFGWSGTGSDALLHDFLEDIDRSNFDALPDTDGIADGYVPTIGVNPYLEPIVVRTDEVDVWVLEANLSAVPGVLGEVTRVDIDNNRAFEVSSTAVATDRFIDMVKEGNNFWITGYDTGTANGFVQKLTIGKPSVMAAKVPVAPAAADQAVGIVYDGSAFLWMASQLNLIRISPAAPGGPYVTTALGPSVVKAVAFDGNTANYADVQPRIWVAETANQVRRIDLTPAIDGLVPLPITPEDVATGGGAIWVAGPDGFAVFNLIKITPDPPAAGVPSPAINAVLAGGIVFSVAYDSSSNKVWVFGQDALGTAQLIRCHPVSLAVEVAVPIPPVFFYPGIAPPRITVFDGYVWVPLIGNGTGAADRVVKVDPVTLSTEILEPLRQLNYEAPAGGGIVPPAGDIGGTVPAPVVVGLQTVPVSPAVPAPGDALVYNGIDWAPSAVGGATTPRDEGFDERATLNGWLNEKRFDWAYSIGLDPRGIASDGTSLWVLDFILSTVQRYNPLTGQPDAPPISLAFSGLFNPVGIIYVAGSLWITGISGPTAMLIQVDPILQTAAPAIPLPAFTVAGHHPASDGQRILIPTWDGATPIVYVEYDISAAAVTATYISTASLVNGVTGTMRAHYFDGAFHITDIVGPGVPQIDRCSSTTGYTPQSTIGLGNIIGLAFDGSNYWLLNDGLGPPTTLYRCPKTGGTFIAVGGDNYLFPFGVPAEVVFDGEFVWVTLGGFGGAFYRVDPRFANAFIGLEGTILPIPFPVAPVVTPTSPIFSIFDAASKCFYYSGFGAGLGVARVGPLMPGPQSPSSFGRRVRLTSVAGPAYFVGLQDEHLSVKSGVATLITLPQFPFDGMRVDIKDQLGVSGGFGTAITVDPWVGHTLDGVPPPGALIMAINYMSITLTFDAAALDWSIT